MGHSAKFEKVKNYYTSMYWTKEMVRNAAKNPPSSPWITEAECEEIIIGGKDQTQESSQITKSEKQEKSDYQDFTAPVTAGI